MDSSRLLVCASSAMLLVLCACSAGSIGQPSGASGPSALPMRVAAKPADSLFYVTNFHTLTLYDTAGGSLEATMSTRQIEFPIALAADKSGNLYVGNSAGGNHDDGQITQYGPTSPKVVRTIAKGVWNPFSLAVDSAGNVYSANQFGSSVTVYAPGSKQPLRTIKNGVSVPVVVLLDASDNVYVANTSGTGSITEYPAGGTAPSRTITAGVNLPLSMALDKKGNIFVGNYLGHNVSEYPPGKTTPSHVFDQGIVPVSIAIDAKNDVYVAAYGKKGVTQYAAGSLKTIRTITSGINYPRTVAIAPVGQVVVTNYGINEEAGSVTIYGAKGTAMLHEITDGVESPIAIALAVPHVSIGP